jgi:hypothetical protein
MPNATLLECLFGCCHRNLSRVFTIRKRTYRVCCDCGAEFDYSLETMSIKHQRAESPVRHLFLEKDLR